MTDIPEFARQAEKEFKAGQKNHYGTCQKEYERRRHNELSNPYVIALRERLFSIYENNDLTEDVRGRAYAYWRVCEKYTSKSCTGWPMLKTKRRPEYPEVKEQTTSFVNIITDGDQERRAGWLYGVSEWADRVEAVYPTDEI